MTLENYFQYNYAILLYNNGHPKGFQNQIAAANTALSIPTEEPFRFLKQLPKKNLYGFLSYDLKNHIENLQSNHVNRVKFSPLSFFQAEKETLFTDLSDLSNTSAEGLPKIEFKARVSKEEYISKIKQIQALITEGDVYEMNFCVEFYAENVGIDPLVAFKKLVQISPTPFSCLVKENDKWLICASPERFLKNTNGKLQSEPIKGTARRSSEIHEDIRMRDELYNSEKERAENLMIVDLVRNDLAKVCQAGSVHVDELFGIYSFKQVHQMISTVSGQLKENTSTAAILKATFPMGSMTGAPKIRAMQLIETLENTRRGIFSGSVGYITENGDFDFNVVIRSLMYNQTDKYLSYQVGSAITIDSDPEKEYEECLLKAKAILQVFE